MSEERKPLWPWIVALLIGLPVLYVASFGPAVSLTSRGLIPFESLRYVYGPMVRCWPHCPRALSGTAHWCWNLSGANDIELGFLLYDIQREVRRDSRQK
jgi:hypothetical protein